MKLVIRHLTS